MDRCIRQSALRVLWARRLLPTQLKPSRPTDIGYTRAMGMTAFLLCYLFLLAIIVK